MARPQGHALTKRIVDRLSVDGKDAIFWDRDLPGFGVRVYPDGRKLYVVQTRAFGRSKRVTIGEHGNPVITAQARKQATEIIARIKLGKPAFEPEPAAAPTVADLAARFEREHVAVRCKPLTVRHYGLMLRKHIVPALGHLPVDEVQKSDIVGFYTGLHESPTVANRGADILGHMFRLADAWGWRPSGQNPCRGMKRFKVPRHRERFLTREELARLGEALNAAPAERLASTHAAAAILLLLLTGCRRNEILGLRWDDLNFDSGQMRLPDSKTGPRMVPMPAAAADVFRGLARTPNNPFVFPGRKKGTRLHNLNDSWDRVRSRARLAGVRLHDLRHTYASRALSLGHTLPMIGDLLGHRMVSTTSRYAHLERNAVREAAADVAGNIEHMSSLHD